MNVNCRFIWLILASLAAPLGAAAQDTKAPVDTEPPWLDEVRAQRRAWERAMQAQPPGEGLDEQSRKRREALREEHARRREALEKRHREWQAERERRHQWWLRQTAPPDWNNLWYYRGY